MNSYIILISSRKRDSFLVCFIFTAPQVAVNETHLLAIPVFGKVCCIYTMTLFLLLLWITQNFWSEQHH